MVIKRSSVTLYKTHFFRCQRWSHYYLGKPGKDKIAGRRRNLSPMAPALLCILHATPDFTYKTKRRAAPSA